MRTKFMRAKFKFALKIFLICFFMFLVSIGGYILYTDIARNTFIGVYIDKLEILKNKKSEKTVFIGGSSCTFGIRAEIFQKATGVDSINMCQTAGIPGMFYLDSVDQYLNEGDKLFLAFEYWYYSSDDIKFSDAGINFLLYQDPSIIKLRNSKELAMNFLDFVRYGWACYENTIRDSITYNTKGFGVYSRDSINEFGDMISHIGEKPIDFDKGSLVTFSPGEFLDKLDNRIQELSKRGVEVYLVYEPVILYRYNQVDMVAVHNQLSKIKNLIILGNPDDYLYEEKYFYNTFNHLGYEGSKIHTENIINKYEKK